jgi:predicted permease
MIEILLALLPVFMVIALGYGLYRSGAMGEPVWVAVEHLVYYLLFPALIVRTVATADFSDISVLGLLLGFLLALAVSTLLLVAGKPIITRAFGLDDASYTSLFQACTRWHGFMALAMVTAIYGPDGVAIVAVALAGLVPALNVVNVMVLMRWGERGDAVRPAMLGQLVRNPFIISCAVGALLNATGLGLPQPLLSAVELLGDGALGASLLSIGAGLRPVHTGGETGAIVFSMVFRLILTPMLFFAALTLFGVTGEARAVGVICGSVPTAASAYVLARKMGGNAPLMANMITAHVIAAAVTLPLVIWLLDILSPA